MFRCSERLDVEVDRDAAIMAVHVLLATPRHGFRQRVGAASPAGDTPIDPSVRRNSMRCALAILAPFAFESDE